MWGDFGNHGWWWGGGGATHMLLFWIVLILVVAVLAKWVFDKPSDGSHAAPHGKSALDILKDRYARGEIGKDEFEQKKRDLEG